MAYQLAVALYKWSNSSAEDRDREKAVVIRDNYMGFPIPWLAAAQNARVEEAKPRPIGHGKSQIRLAYGSVCDEAVFHIMRMLESTSAVESLDLQFNEVTDVGAEDIATGLRSNASITDLNLAHNYLSDKAFAAIASALAANRSLLTLSLASNRATTAGAVALITSIQLNRTLRRLVLTDLNLGPDVARQLVAALRGNQSAPLDSLELQRNALGESGGKIFADFLADHTIQTSLTKLNLAFNNLGDGAGLAFADAFGVATGIENVDLYGNPFTDRVAFAIVAAVPLTSKLSFLSVGGSSFGPDGQSVLRAFESFHNKRLAVAAAIDPTISSSASILIHVHDGALALPGRAPRCPAGHLLYAGFSAELLASSQSLNRIRCAECEKAIKVPSVAVFYCAVCGYTMCYGCARRSAKALQNAQNVRDVFWERFRYAGISPP